MWHRRIQFQESLHGLVAAILHLQEKLHCLSTADGAIQQSLHRAAHSHVAGHLGTIRLHQMASVPPSPRHSVACSDRSDLLVCGLFPGPQHLVCVRNETHPVRIGSTERGNVKIFRMRLGYCVHRCQTAPLFDGHKIKKSTNYHRQCNQNGGP